MSASVKTLAGVRLGLGHLPHARVRHLAAHEGDVLHARHAHVGDEHAVAEQMAGVLLAQQARADPPLGGRMTRHVRLIFPVTLYD